MIAASAIAFSATTALASPVTQTGGNGLVVDGDEFIVYESLSGNQGVYNVFNDTSGVLTGFGVSNNLTFAGLYNTDGLLETAPGSEVRGYTFRGTEVVYSPRTLTAFSWGTEEIAAGVTFETAFGSFQDAAGGDFNINWYDAVDGKGLGIGEGIETYFGFEGLNLASSVIGAVSTRTGPAYFSAGEALPGTGPSATIPLPAAGWMLIAAIAGLGVMTRRRKSA
jgi:hypothetical protein